MRNRIIALAAAAAAVAAPAAAAPGGQERAPAGEEVSIPFARLGGIRSFEAREDDVVYLQDRHRNWYRAELYGPCFGLRWAFGIGIDTRGSSSFDRFSALIVGKERCQIGSLTRSEGPPKKVRRPRRG
ncbi:MAG: hypothetical protein JOZ90_14635 [Alphaproteobacteria bacterium]|nr:hypothetical protein [Alphaproteobacteria bacterium]MBV9372179.1 hypothetical protein [Alphaproteobacteria bacterium]MBV9902310.1 hypothetical protein [Alphaproteobacteria bacterium]